MKGIVLVSTPWPLFNRPSVQLGSLKAFVRQNTPEIQVDAKHFYLSIAEEIGYDLYGNISERTWLAETPYAALLYPNRMSVIERFWKKRSSGVPIAKEYDLSELCGRLARISSRVVDSEDWDRYILAGFSICFGQLTSSLFFIREIKKSVPTLRIVVGGSACAGDLGVSLLDSFPEIDFVIQGEGELPLVNLINNLMGTQEDSGTVSIPGLVSRYKFPKGQTISQVPNLDQLPTPEYEDYFRQLQDLEPEKRFLPRVPMEISRGCWWRKSLGSKGPSGCAFCNLNLQWQGYRAKSHKKVIAELDSLTNEHQILSVSFMDNLLPFKGLKALFDGIVRLKKDFRLFAEIRATTPRNVLAAMGEAGVREVQVGVESLSTSLLQKLNKGTTAMDNMEIMKNCETPGLPNLTGNLILNFPSSDEQDVAETISNLEFALPFRPVRGIPFWLGYGSPVWQMPDVYGIKKLANHPYYGYLFPQEILGGLSFIIQGYQGGVRGQKRLWRPVKEKMEEWRRNYFRLHELESSGPILSFQDGQDFMIIRQRRYKNHDMTHRLRNTSRKIYLFCQTQRSIRQILARFPGFGEDKVGPFLRMMVGKRLMFNEGDRYLSLAVPIKGCSLI
jgi:ribosomal peptide maturation radical SAM protein 1